MNNSDSSIDTRGTEDAFLRHLCDRCGLVPTTAAAALRVQQETMERLAPILLKLGLYSEDALATHMGEFATVSRLTGAITATADLEPALSVPFLRAHQVI